MSTTAKRSKKKAHRLNSRVNLRIKSAEKQRLAQGAALAGQSLTDFMISASMAAAENLLASRTHFKLSDANWRKFNEMLDRPARDLPGLKKLFAKPSVLPEE